MKQKIDDNFKYNLMTDTNDIYDNSNSQNRFYTMPVTSIVNDQTEFAKLCYYNDGKCKEGKQKDCANKRGTVAGRGGASGGT